uniref:Leucine-rich transmembrane protein n=1 Tax=Rhipicephalus appendiculatus TaxID=34631 RepID=A0A131Z636_RHIAP
MTPSRRKISHAFHRLLLLPWVIQWSSCAPSCFYSTGPSGQVTYTCSGLRSSTDLVDNFKPNRNATEGGRLKLLIENSVLERVPQGLFAGLGVSTLQLDNVELTGSWSPTEPTPLRGLESTLEKVVFSHNSTVPRNWAVFLAGMTELVEMVFFDMSGLRFTSSSQEGLPRTLRKLHLVRSSIASADDYWLSSLVDLQTLSLRHVNLTAFARTVLPTVAAKLETLLLEDCSLTSFPSGLDKGLPSLKYVGLQKNHIVQLGSDDVSPLINKGIVLQLRGNPLSCDCHLQFLFENSRRHSVYGQCDAPTALKGRSLRALSERDIAPCARRQATQSL